MLDIYYPTVDITYIKPFETQFGLRITNELLKTSALTILPRCRNRTQSVHHTETQIEYYTMQAALN